MEHGPSVSATVCFTMTHPPPNTSTHRSHPCHRSFPVSVRASNRKGTLDQWPSDSHRLITSHSSPTSLFWAPPLLGEQLFTLLCLPINLFMLFFSILFITSFSDIHITRPLNHSKTHIHARIPLLDLDVATQNRSNTITIMPWFLYRGRTAIKWRLYFTDKLFKS